MGLSQCWDATLAAFCYTGKQRAFEADARLYGVARSTSRVSQKTYGTCTKDEQQLWHESGPRQIVRTPNQTWSAPSNMVIRMDFCFSTGVCWHDDWNSVYRDAIFCQFVSTYVYIYIYSVEYTRVSSTYMLWVRILPVSVLLAAYSSAHARHVLVWGLGMTWIETE